MGVGESIRGLRVVATIATTVALFATLASGAQAAFSVTPTRTIPMPNFGFGGYAPGFDGTFWTVSTGANSGGTVSHVDDEGNDLGDSFAFKYEAALGIAYYGGRVYVPLASSFGRLVGVNVNNPEDILIADSETSQRAGSNQFILRSYPDGSASAGFGQTNKVASFDLKDGDKTHPWYPQSFYGNGINDVVYKPPPEGNAFETCRLGLGGVPVFGEPTKCGKYGGYHPDATHVGFDYPDDTAFGLGGMYVAEAGANKITHINTVANPGATIDMEFGFGPGTAAGQLSGPGSIVVQPSSGYLYVTEEGNRRISVFDGQGAYLNSFGYGVRDGADEMQVCGLEIGPCQAGVSYQTDPRSYFSRLDFGPQGELLAQMPLAGAIQVFGVAGAPGERGGGTPGGPGGGPPGSPGGGSPEETVRLAATPLKVVKGKKTKLTATVNRGKSCANRKVLFQVKVPRSWENLGSVNAGTGCTAHKARKVKAMSIFRAVLIDTRNQATIAHSPQVTVKLKPKRKR
jgi:DNA-binding beta-propeller fold protein YncE